MLRPTDEVRSRAGFDPDQRSCHRRRVSKQLFPRELLPYDDLSILIQCDEVKRRLTQIDAISMR